MDATRKMAAGHTTADLDEVIDEVAEARGEYDDLAARLDAIEARLAALEEE